MRFGITAFLTDRSIDPASFGRAVEERGFDALYVPEHTHIPTSRRTPAPMGEPLPERYYHLHDPFIALTAVAAVTERIRIGTGICLLAQRDAIVTAKAVASLDQLSGGRFTLGVGFGWNREEIEAHGTPYGRRRDRTRETVLAMKELWTKDEAAFDGEFVRFKPSWAWPKCAQRPHVPIFLGGMGGPKLFTHIAEWADGWMPIGGGGIKANLAALHAECERVGRDPATVSIIPFGSIPDQGKLEYFSSLGIEEVVLGVEPGPPDVVLPVLDNYREIVEALA